MAFLSEQRAMHLSTTGSEGPHAAPLFYAFDPDALRLIFLSARQTRHIHEILRDSRAAASVAQPGPEVDEIRGAQLWGKVRASVDPAAALLLYLGRFAEAGNYLPRDVLSQIWEFQVERARWIDNRRGFGHRIEWDFLQNGGRDART
ncbi:MAG: pyridoxamine 5'-phosphate oxidase family protein [Deltaproteobacteria bacterium]|nr:pyridoxamine 5'-phosphate oxidase family protein [Deltaproteobacteria bacterium]